MNRRIRKELRKPRSVLETPRYKWLVKQSLRRWLARVNQAY